MNTLRTLSSDVQNYFPNVLAVSLHPTVHLHLDHHPLPVSGTDTVHGLLEQLDEVTRGQGNMTSQELVLVVNTLENSLAEGSALTVNTSVQAVVNVLSTLLTVDESQLQLAQEESKIPERLDNPVPSPALCHVTGAELLIKK